MSIAIYLGDLPPQRDLWNAEHTFVYEIVSRILNAHPEEKFLLLSDEPIAGIFPENQQVERITLGKLSPGILSLYSRWNYKLPAYLKHSGARVLVSMRGVLPFKGDLPTCLFLPDEALMEQKASPKDRFQRYRKRYLSRSLQKAGQVAVLSDFGRQRLMSAYQLPEYKIKVTGRGIQEQYEALDWETREKIKEQYTEGREFLLYTGEINTESNLINLLKAFSILKKKMNPEMVLMLAGKPDKGFKKFPELLRTYQFRKEVKVTGDLSRTEIARIMGAAYVLVIPSLKINFTSLIPEALKCLTPLLAVKNTLYEKEAGEAAMYFELTDYQELGELFCELYKKEELRAQLIVQANEQAKEYSWKQASERFWEAIQAALGTTRK